MNTEGEKMKKRISSLIFATITVSLLSLVILAQPQMSQAASTSRTTDLTFDQFGDTPPSEEPGSTVLYGGRICNLTFHPTKGYLVADIFEDACGGPIAGAFLACTNSSAHLDCPEEGSPNEKYLYSYDLLLTLYENMHRAQLAGQYVMISGQPLAIDGDHKIGYHIVFSW